MRIIGHHDHSMPDHWASHFANCPIILVDGRAVEHVTEADDVAGYVVLQEYENGRPKTDLKRGIFITRRIEGKVEIIGTPQPLWQRQE